jgi:hypothetical protein
VSLHNYESSISGVCAYVQQLHSTESLTDVLRRRATYLLYYCYCCCYCMLLQGSIVDFYDCYKQICAELTDLMNVHSPRGLVRSESALVTRSPKRGTSPTTTPTRPASTTARTPPLMQKSLTFSSSIVPTGFAESLANLQQQQHQHQRAPASTTSTAASSTAGGVSDPKKKLLLVGGAADNSFMAYAAASAPIATPATSSTANSHLKPPTANHLDGHR